MHPILTSAISGLMDGVFCLLIHAVFVLAALIYLIRVFVSPQPAGWHGTPRWVPVLTVFCVADTYWATITNGEGCLQLGLLGFRILPIAPVLFLLCLVAPFVSSVIHRKMKKQNKTLLPTGNSPTNATTNHLCRPAAEKIRLPHEYSLPNDRMNTQNRTSGKYIAIGGACLQAGPLIGQLISVVGMRKAYASIDSNGTVDKTVLNSSIGDVMVATTAGTIVGLIGVILIIISLFACRYRAAWFYWFLLIYGVIFLLAFPIGTIVGIVFIVYSRTNRSQFFAPTPPSSTPQNPSILP